MNLYQEILKATEGLHGWCDPNKQITLANLVLLTHAKVIVEIGVWGGKSLIPMAIAAKHDLLNLSNAHVVGIDPWLAQASIKGQEGEDAKWWNNQEQHDAVYEHFRNALVKNGLTTVEVWRDTSDNCLSKVYKPIDVLHVDGNHSLQGLKDVMNYAPLIKPAGFCVLDDLNWTGGAVGQAAEWLKGNGFLELHPLGTGAVFMRL